MHSLTVWPKQSHRDTNLVRFYVSVPSMHLSKIFSCIIIDHLLSFPKCIMSNFSHFPYSPLYIPKSGTTLYYENESINTSCISYILYIDTLYNINTLCMNILLWKWKYQYLMYFGIGQIYIILLINTLYRCIIMYKYIN